MPATRIVTIIDDDEEVRVATENLVLSYGLEARTFASAEAFLDARAEADTGCLITDVQMSGMGGLDLHAALLRTGYDIPTIFITAFPEDRLRQRAQAQGAIGFLAKPFAADSLMGCIVAAFGASP